MNFLVNPIVNPLFQILITFVLCSGILNFGKTFDQLTKETVKAFLVDSKKSRFKI